MDRDDQNPVNAKAVARLEMELRAMHNAAVRLSLALRDVQFEMDVTQRKESVSQTNAVLEKVRHLSFP